MAKPFRVFGIGLNKTGTSTLRAALRKLGYRHFGHSAALVRAYARRDWAAIFEVADAHESFEDWPWPLVWRQMHERYGEDARFILTRRHTPEAWLASLKAHAERAHPGGFARRIAYGWDYPHGREAEHLEVYARHLDGIRNYFAHPARRHLMAEFCWEEGDGWRELCRFLGERRRRGPFPHVNASAQAQPDPRHLAANRERIAQQLASISRRAPGSGSR
ncbi:MAG: hypothetical protein D6754_11830 [Alphaproteobacteria bacterium]|nr:MAG: hypothetical protein D6754_11830 [Alphaproteobacteria bacterium]